MILKDRESRQKEIDLLLGLKAQQRGALEKKVLKEITKLRKGEEGEQEAAFMINRAFGQSKNFGVLHDLRIEYRGEVAQIDHLLVNRIQGRVWICETKNYSGTLSCNEHGEWTQWFGKNGHSISSPFEQARRQKAILERWLSEKGYSDLSITPLVLVPPTTRLSRKNMPTDVEVRKWDNFESWLRAKIEDVGVKDAFTMVAGRLIHARNVQWLETLGAKLVDAHSPRIVDWPTRLALPSPAAPTFDMDKLLETVATPYGDIEFRTLTTGDVAFKTPANEVVIEASKAVLKGKARWNARYRNWLVKPEDFPELRRQFLEYLLSRSSLAA